MKRLLIIWVGLLLALPSIAQKKTPQRLARRDPATGQIKYYLLGSVPTNTYSVPGGKTQYQRDASSGLLNLIVEENGIVIPAGTVPPLEKPQPPTGTNPLLSSRFTYNSNQQLSIEGAPAPGQPVELKFEPVTGSLPQIRSNLGQNLTPGTYYPSGPLQNQGEYTQEWSLYNMPQVPIRITWRRISDGVTHSYVFGPVTATKQLLFTRSSGNDPPPTGGATFVRVVFQGNSITKHPNTPPGQEGSQGFTIGEGNAWGMAATTQANDYVHKLVALMRQSSPDVQYLASGNGSFWEQQYQSGYNYSQITNEVNTAFGGLPPTHIYISISENVDAGQFNEAAFRSGLDQLIAAHNPAPTTRIYLRNSFWNGKENVNAVLQNYATQKGYGFVDLSDIREGSAYTAQNDWQQASPGVKRHPGNNGMTAIANKSWAVINNSGSGGNPGPGPGPSPGNGEFISYADQGWSGADYKTLNNGLVTVKIRRSVGGCVCHLSSNSDGRGLVNDYLVDLGGGRGIGSDKGRQMQVGSDYFTPGVQYQIGGDNTGWHGFDTGANTVQGGSQAPFFNESTVLASSTFTHRSGGQGLYVKVRPKIWGANDKDGNIILEQWIWLEPGKPILGYFARHTVLERDNSQTTWQSREQENPCIYTIPRLRNHKVSLAGNPFSGAGATNWSNYQGYFTPTVRTTEHWVGGYDVAGSGIGLTLYQPQNSSFKAGLFNFGDLNAGEFGNDAGYINGAPLVNYDSPGVYEDYGYVIVGTESQARSHIYNDLPRPDYSFDFDFTKDNVKWWNFDAKFRKENGKWRFYVGDAKTDNNVTSFIGKISAPYRSYKASEITQLEITFIGQGFSALNLNWEKPGPENSNGYTKTISVTPTGSQQTIVISTSHPDWNGMLSTIGIGATNGSTSNGAYMDLIRIRKL
ncbi:SGNH/GDSL hydrolase family protein [Fibrisoma montanum]|uniref:SGNH/GDSL hydrolase family protein n=1 Tax=Fibrisoma montanum TaxID=2305895 RepID=A0A418M434_9BACT|nr:SGNH/GDSL hydrolase family protein [Fibrisoma montanum]RIV20518.1 SGNH/GDSL hydrolase family protein [Fibrisoma montanum]